MAVKQIPARTEVTCDACNAVDPVRKAEGKLTIKQHALDYSGTPCADASRVLDLCDNCLVQIVRAINTTAAAIRGNAEGKTAEGGK